MLNPAYNTHAMAYCVECLHRSKGKKRVETLPGRLWCAACAPENRQTVAAAPEFPARLLRASARPGVRRRGDVSRGSRALEHTRAQRTGSRGLQGCVPTGSGAPSHRLGQDKWLCLWRVRRASGGQASQGRAAEPPSRYDTISVYISPDGGIIRRMVRVGASVSGDPSGKPAAVVTGL